MAQPLLALMYHPRYFSIFIIYTPYTIYQCECTLTPTYIHAEHGCRQFRRTEGMVQDGPPGWLEMSHSTSSEICWNRSSVCLDALLALCDVEGNYFVVKVRQFSLIMFKFTVWRCRLINTRIYYLVCSSMRELQRFLFEFKPIEPDPALGGPFLYVSFCVGYT
jgi:hypothetical protein